MEPALDERGDLIRERTDLAVDRAAMEPALDERGDLGRPVCQGTLGAAAAMEPALDERGDPRGSPRYSSQAAPQWSPLSTSGATGTAAPRPLSTARCRNGARSRRAGRHQGGAVGVLPLPAA